MKFFSVFLSLFLTVRAVGLEFQDDDKVVLLGNTVIERAQKYGYFEAALTLASGKEKIRFRNLGWSGDTVEGTARSYFGPPKEGFDRLKADLTELKPTVVIVCYGAVAAFEGESGLENFTEGYNRLLEMITATASPREIVLVSPPPAETLPPPMPDLSEHNNRLAMYRDAIRKLAAARELIFADLFEAMKTSNEGLTDNGIHYTEDGYRVLAEKLVGSLDLGPLPKRGLKSLAVYETRQAIIAKNRLFFQKWRPANETYLRLFRKHEQGQNAKELAEFDPLISKAERVIEEIIAQSQF